MKTAGDSLASARGAVLAGLVLVVVLAVPATALLTQGHPVGGNTFTTTTVDPPTLDDATASTLLCQIRLEWTPPGTGAAPDGYDIYRSTTSGGSYTFLDHVGTGTSYADASVVASTTYHYVVESTRDSWRSVASNEESATAPFLLCI